MTTLIFNVCFVIASSLAAPLARCKWRLRARSVLPRILSDRVRSTLLLVGVVLVSGNMIIIAIQIMNLGGHHVPTKLSTVVTFTFLVIGAILAGVLAEIPEETATTS